MAASATTFVQTDRDTFRDLVQKLTGLNPDAPNLSNSNLSPPRRSTFKLHQRRRHATRKLITYPRRQQFVPSPVTRLELSLFFSGGVRDDDRSADTLKEVEERSTSDVAEKLGFCLQTVTTTRGSEPPELLPLFPLSPPEVEV